MAEVREAGPDNVYFGYAVDPKGGPQHSYRVTAPTFAIEFLNVQKDSAGNAANHIHSAWRNPRGDFGLTK